MLSLFDVTQQSLNIKLGTHSSLSCRRSVHWHCWLTASPHLYWVWLADS